MRDLTDYEVEDGLAQARGIARLLEEMCREIYPERGPKSLHPRQWSALRYFGRYGPSTGTITGLAAYAGVTTSPASRCVASLVRNGLLRAANDQPNRKSTRYEITDAGRDMLRRDPLDAFARRIARMTAADRCRLARMLENLLRWENGAP